MSLLASMTFPCPRCARQVIQGTPVERVGTLAGGVPQLAHVGCRAASPAERMILQGGSGVDDWGTPEFTSHAGTAGPAEYNGQTTSRPPTPPRPGTAAAATSVPAKAPAAGGPVELTPAQLDDLKRTLADRSAKFAADALAVKIEQLAIREAETLTQKVGETVEKKLAASGARAVARQVAESVKQAGDAMAARMDEVLAEARAMIGSADQMHRAALARLDETRRQVLVIETPDLTTEFPADELFHKAFPEAFKLAANGFNVFMVGPTGSGKSTIGEQIARGLNRGFGLVNGSAGTTEVELFGRSMPNLMTGDNVYIPSEFVTLYESGGVFMVDEFDALDANLALRLNGAIAQGYCAVPHRTDRPRAVRHRDFVFLATANTWGGGASRDYCGRNQLDEATLDRLKCGAVVVDYDERLERAVCPDAELYELLLAWRENIALSRIRRILSTRFVAGAYRLSRIGYSHAGIASKLVAGWPDREFRQVLGELADAAAAFQFTNDITEPTAAAGGD